MNLLLEVDVAVLQLLPATHPITGTEVQLCCPTVDHGCGHVTCGASVS